MPIKGSPRTKRRSASKESRREITWLDYFVGGWEKGFMRGVLEGKADAVLEVLERRQIPVSEANRTRVLDTCDLLEVETWFDRAFTVASAEALFDPSPARSKRRSSTAPARSARTRTKPQPKPRAKPQPKPRAKPQLKPRPMLRLVAK